MSKIDRRILKTKEAIHKAFIELLTEKNFNNITINEIAERANINRGTLYLHFTDKYDLIEKSIENHLERLTNSCILKKSGLGFDMEESLLLVFEYFEENYLFYSTMLEKTNFHCFRERLLQLVIEQNKLFLKTRENNDTLTDEIDAQFIATAFVGVVEWWIKHRMPLPPIEIARHMSALISKNL